MNKKNQLILLAVLGIAAVLVAGQFFSSSSSQEGSRSGLAHLSVPNRILYFMANLFGMHLSDQNIAQPGQGQAQANGANSLTAINGHVQGTGLTSSSKLPAGQGPASGSNNGNSQSAVGSAQPGSGTSGNNSASSLSGINSANSSDNGAAGNFAGASGNNNGSNNSSGSNGSANGSGDNSGSNGSSGSSGDNNNGSNGSSGNSGDNGNGSGNTGSGDNGNGPGATSPGNGGNGSGNIFGNGSGGNTGNGSGSNSGGPGGNFQECVSGCYPGCLPGCDPDCTPNCLIGITNPSNLPIINPVPTDTGITLSIEEQNQQTARLEQLLASRQALTNPVMQQAQATKYQTIDPDTIPAPSTDPGPSDIVQKLRSNQISLH